MGEVIKFKRPSPAGKGKSTAQGSAQEQTLRKGNTLCRNGFHKWELVKERPFDVKEGKLVNRYRCTRCGATRTEAR